MFFSELNKRVEVLEGEIGKLKERIMELEDDTGMIAKGGIYLDGTCMPIKDVVGSILSHLNLELVRDRGYRLREIKNKKEKCK